MFITELLLEATENRHASFCFGRMNPPTIGHKQLINAVASASKGGDYFIFVSQTQDAKKNPLSYDTKTKFLKELFPDQASHIVHAPELKTIMQVAEWLYNKGYRAVTFVAGSDRLPEFEKLLNAYNGMEGKNIYYKFDSIQFASSGERDPDAEGVTGVSASAAREAAVEGNEEKFAQITGAGQYAPALYQAVRQGMGLQDTELAEGDMEDFIKKLKKDSNEKDANLQRTIRGNDVTGSQKPDSTYDPYSPTPRVAQTDEGWKGALAGAALIGGIGAGMVASNPLTIGDVTYQSSMQGPDSPAESETSRVITHNGKKYLVWKGTGAKPSNRAWKYKEVESQQDMQAKKDRLHKHTEIEPTDLWVNEDIQPGKMYAFLQSVAEFLKKDPKLAGKFYKKDVGMRVWTRGDGTRMRDPAKLIFDDTDLRDYAFDLLKQALTGARQTSVTGEFGSSPAQDALVWKGKLFHKYSDFSIAVGTAGRITNKNSVWKEKPTVESIRSEIARLSEYVADKNNGGGAGILATINELKGQLNEMFGPMGGDQRNMRGSQPAYKEPAGFSGSITVSYPSFKNYALASKYNVSVTDSGASEKNLTIKGDKKNIKRFLVAAGWNSQDLKNWYPELHEEDTTDSLKKDISDIANKIGSTLEKLNVQRAIRDKHLANQKQEPKTVKECSGYIPKNAKEAKDPRWSNALSVDVDSSTPAKNLKAFGL